MLNSACCLLLVLSASLLPAQSYSVKGKYNAGEDKASIINITCLNGTAHITFTQSFVSEGEQTKVSLLGNGIRFSGSNTVSADSGKKVWIISHNPSVKPVSIICTGKKDTGLQYICSAGSYTSVSDETGMPCLYAPDNGYFRNMLSMGRGSYVLISCNAVYWKGQLLE